MRLRDPVQAMFLSEGSDLGGGRGDTKSSPQNVVPWAMWRISMNSWCGRLLGVAFGGRVRGGWVCPSDVPNRYVS